MVYCDSLGRQTKGNPEQASYWLRLACVSSQSWHRICFIMHTRGTSHVCNYCLTVLYIASFNLEPNCFAGWQKRAVKNSCSGLNQCETIFGTVWKLVMEILNC